MRFGGRTFEGYYAVQSNMVTVWNPALGSRTARIGEVALPALADTLLLEVVQECSRYQDFAACEAR